MEKCDTNDKSRKEKMLKSKMIVGKSFERADRSAQIIKCQQDFMENLIEKLLEHFSKIKINRALREANRVVNWMINFGHLLITS